MGIDAGGLLGGQDLQAVPHVTMTSTLASWTNSGKILAGALGVGPPPPCAIRCLTLLSRDRIAELAELASQTRC